MNDAIIFLDGDKSDLSQIRKYVKDGTLLIGCDGGTKKLLELGCRPHAVVGDFDSFDEDLVRKTGAELVKHPTDKDYTDSEAAIRYALQKGAKKIILAGFSGSRTDHMIGNVFLLNKHEFAGVDIRIIESGYEIYLIRKRAVIKGKKGDPVSFIPIFGEVRAISSSGLKYDLADYILSMQGNTGISNEFTAGKAVVALKKDDVLLVVQRTS